MWSSIQLQAFNLPVGTLDISNQTNIPINGSLILLNTDQTRVVKKIFFRYTNSFFAAKFADIRLRALNRDGVIKVENGGTIINPVSGAWGGLVKNTDLDIVLSTKKNFIDFEEGIKIGGFQFISYSVGLYFPANQVFTVSFNIDVEYE